MSLLELSPSSTEEALTRSERGGSRFGRYAGFVEDDDVSGDDAESCFFEFDGAELVDGGFAGAVVDGGLFGEEELEEF